MDDLGKAVRMQAYATILSSPLPGTLKKKILYQMLKEISVELPIEELKELEDFFKAKLVLCSQCDHSQPEFHVYCFFCGAKFSKQDVKTPR